MRLIVTLLLIAIVLGAVVIEIRVNTIVWKEGFDIWKRARPRWQAWLWLGIVVAIAIASLILARHYPPK